MSDINTTLNACELVWRQHSLADQTVTDMRAELASHLTEAGAAGKDPSTVTGTDIDAFARSWITASPARTMPGPSRLQQNLTERATRARARLVVALAGIVVIALAAMIFGGRTDAADVEIWQWVFVGAACALLIGEMLSGGFFVLPFGVGAAAAAGLAFMRVEPVTLWLVFILVSTLALWGLREFASKDDDVIVPVGANRYVGQNAVVTDAIRGVGTVGRVRIETESWMAISDSNQHITDGTVVTITEVRGARLVVATP